jgi:hypothetical protein
VNSPGNIRKVLPERDREEAAVPEAIERLISTGDGLTDGPRTNTDNGGNSTSSATVSDRHLTKTP